MEYIKTKFGNIHLNNIPIVRDEPFTYKFNKAMMFYSIIILILFIIISMIVFNDKPVKMHIDPILQQQHSSIKMSVIDVYNYNEKINLENIILITTDNNLINIDIKHNAFVKHNDIQSGNIYTINLQQEYVIREIMLISDAYKYITSVNIDLYNLTKNNKKVWEYSGYLKDTRENSIQISKLVLNHHKIEPELLSDNATTTEVITMNEDNLMLKLSENGEEYKSY